MAKSGRSFYYEVDLSTGIVTPLHRDTVAPPVGGARVGGGA